MEDIRVAQAAHDDGRYADAIAQLDLAWTTLKSGSRGHKLDALDLRCQTRVKLSQLDLALEDAKQMIRLDRHNARGYCRASSICKIMRRWEDAARWARHGLTHIGAADPLHRHLTDQLDKIGAAVAQIALQKKAVDPMTCLPLELIEMVLAHLDYREITRLLRVSRSWRRLLSMVEPLISTVRFDQARTLVHAWALRSVLRRLVRPNQIYIENMRKGAAEHMQATLIRWSKTKHLDTLHLNETKVPLRSIDLARFKLRTLHVGLQHEVRLGQAIMILNSCSTLEKATFRRVSQTNGHIPEQRNALQELELGNPFDLACFNIPDGFFNNYPHLTALSIIGASMGSRSSWDLSRHAELRHLETYGSLLRWIQLPPNLETWFWDGTETRHFGTWADISPITEPSSGTDLTKLHSLCLSAGNATAALRYLSRCPIRAGQLKKVGLHFRQSTEVLVHPQIRHNMLDQATEVSFESESITDDDAEAFVSQFPVVEVLQLAAPKISGVFIATLLRRPENHIAKLILKDCRNVSPDTVDWARARSVVVEIHLGQIEVRGGRRLREGWF